MGTLARRGGRIVSVIDHIHPNHAISVVTGYSRDNGRGREGIKIGGCGMDMGFALVNSLSERLYGGKRCDCGRWHIRRPAQHGIAALGEWEYQHADEWKPYLQGALRFERRPEEPLDGGAEYFYQYIANCERCKGSGNVIGTGYQCLGKGKCPSNYHNNHRDRLRCEGVTRDGEQVRCARPNDGFFGKREEVPEDWPIREIPIGETGEVYRQPLTTLFTPEGDYGREVCPTCGGVGDVPNPEGPERFDLEHFDGYAVSQRWL